MAAPVSAFEVSSLERLRKNCGHSKGRALLQRRRRSSAALPIALIVIGDWYENLQIKGQIKFKNAI
jgi:hypothetical protein